MDAIRDPEEIETRYLHQLGGLNDQRVLEIGAGNGRMTWRYAPVARSIVGIDADAERLAEALSSRPAALTARVSFALAAAETLPFADESFDVVILAWSL